MVYREMPLPYICLKYYPLALNMTGCRHVRTESVDAYSRHLLGFVMSVRLSLRMEQLGCHWTDFHEIRYLSIFRKYILTLPASLKFD
jgi:hypothetical protein